MDIHSNLNFRSAAKAIALPNATDNTDAVAFQQINTVVPTIRGQIIGHNGTVPAPLAPSNTTNHVLKGNPNTGVGFVWGFPNFATPNAVRTGNFTVQAAEAFSFFVCNGTFTVTIPNNSHTNGSMIMIYNAGTGTITVSPAANVSIVGQTTISTQNQCLKLCLGIRTAAVPPQDTWYAFI